MLILLQARLRSSRLPAKGFLPFFGQTVWERMCDIALAVGGENDVVFATGDLEENSLAKELVERKGVRFRTGHESDVLSRFCEIVKDSRHEHILRITCDNYLAQPQVIDDLAHTAIRDGVGYAYVSPLSHYAGEYIQREVLLSANYSPTPEAREHVTWDIRRSRNVRSIELPRNFCGLRHEFSPTLDTIDDFILMKKLEIRYPGLRSVRCLQTLREIEFLN